MTVNIAVFAHNEQDNIQRCLLSIIQSIKDPEALRIKVLNNGSIDNTANIVSNLASEYSQIELIEIEKGCKCNAWNQYVYGHNIDLKDNHYFLDGDTWLPAYTLEKLEEEFDTEKYWCVAPIPIGISERNRNDMKNNDFVYGSLYGLSSEFIETIQKNNFKLPVGFIGDDSLVTYILQEGFDLQTAKKAIKIIENAGTVIPRLELNLKTVSLMHSRYKRYAMRHFEQEIFYYFAKQNNLRNLPTISTDCYKYLFKIRKKAFFKYCGIQTLYHPYALLKILLS